MDYAVSFQSDKPPEPLGVRFESMDIGVSPSGRVTITGVVKFKAGYARIVRTGSIRRVSRGMRRHIRRRKAAERRCH